MQCSSTNPASLLRQDIRLLGKTLGDVIHEADGQEMFSIIESLRRYAVRYRREGEQNELVALELNIPKLSKEQALTVARAFAYFLHLSNIAEDREQNRQHNASDPATQAGSLERALAVLSPQHSREELLAFLPTLTSSPY